MYLSPRMKVMKVQQTQIICTSPGFKTERLEEETFNWEEE